VIPDHERRALFRDLAAQPSGAWVTCASGSMEPTIRPGDRVRIRACRGDQIRVGEVVLFETLTGGSLVLHRVVLRLPWIPYFLHLGDAGRPAGPGIAHLSRVLGRADLPRHPPSPRVLAQSVVRGLRAGGRLLGRRLRATR
jgi:hypothetical protein